MKYKIKKELMINFEHTDCVGVFDLTNLNSFSGSDDTSFSKILNKDFNFFEKWIQDGKHAGMKFLENNFNARKDPSFILKDAKTAIVFLFAYAHGHRVRGKKNSEGQIERMAPAVKPRDETAKLSDDNLKNSLFAKKLVSKYAYSKDYHKIIKKRLEQYALSLQQSLKSLDITFSYRPIVDSIPFFERAYARETGLGFVGKNTLLIRPGMGSFFFIATLLTDLDISVLRENSNEVKNNPIFSLNCGDCKRCIEACPTQAIEKNYTLDANKCLSYLTIEHRDTIPENFLKNLDKTIYGCDICQDVCPYNFVTQDVSMLTEFKKIHTPLLSLTAQDIATMTEKQYQLWFGGSAMTRARYEGLVRNALYYLLANKSSILPNILHDLKNSSYPLIQKTVHQIFPKVFQ